MLDIGGGNYPQTYLIMRYSTRLMLSQQLFVNIKKNHKKFECSDLQSTEYPEFPDTGSDVDSYLSCSFRFIFFFYDHISHSQI